ncbi:hypothetical protein SNE40_017245 [Patella caerulea]|uniref:Glycine N-acyltransferase-like protein n=1 Tax=Patella caerulea TaxID=87958 RepID=A0AAN8P9D6_PATCE
MITILQHSDYHQLLNELKKDYVGAHQIVHLMEGYMREKIPEIEIIVDTWPMFNVVVVKPVGLQQHMLYLKNYLIFTKNNTNLGQVLTSQGTVDWTTDGMFIVPQEKDYVSVEKVIEDKHQSNCNNNMFQLTCFTLHAQDLIIYPVPDGMTLRPIPRDMVDTLMDNWEYSDEVRPIYFNYLIDHYKTLALYDVDDSLIGYMLETHYGAIGMLRILPEKRGKGYSKIILSNLCKAVFENGANVLTSGIAPSNEISINLHLKLGFRKTNSVEGWFKFSGKGSAT